MADDFDDKDLADLSSTDAAPAEVDTASDDAIDAALGKFYNKADGREEPEVSKEVSDRRQARSRQRNLDEAEELETDGIQNADEPDEPVESDEPDKKEDAGVEQPAEEKSGEQVPAAETKFDANLRYFAETELGWAPEKVDRLIKADPELAADTIQKFADTYSNLSRQLLQPGPQQVAGNQQAAQPPAQDTSPTPELDKFYSNLSAFAEANGEDLAGFAKSLKAELIDPVRELLATNKVREQDITKSETLDTFGKLTDKFGDLYGKGDDSLTVKQSNARNLLGQVADQLRAGAKAAGQKLPVREALNRAHLLVSAEYRDQVVRNEIKEQVQKRSKAITAKPTQRKNPVIANARSIEAASEALAKKAAELGVAGFDE